MKRIFIFLLTLCVSAVMLASVPMPKREFRGAWIQMINGQFQGMNRDQMQANLTHQLDVLQRCHVNTIIFQVRGEADAMYQSSLEPWTRFLSGQQGVAPQPLWDPLAWMVNECHRRGMRGSTLIGLRRKQRMNSLQITPRAFIQNGLSATIIS